MEPVRVGAPADVLADALPLGGDIGFDGFAQVGPVRQHLGGGHLNGPVARHRVERGVADQRCEAVGDAVGVVTGEEVLLRGQLPRLRRCRCFGRARERVDDQSPGHDDDRKSGRDQLIP